MTRSQGFSDVLISCFNLDYWHRLTFKGITTEEKLLGLQRLWLKLIALHRCGAVNRDHEWLLVHWGCPCPWNLSRHPKKSKLYSCPEGRAISGRLWTTIWWDTLPKNMDFYHPKNKLNKITYIIYYIEYIYYMYYVYICIITYMIIIWYILYNYIYVF